MIQECIKISEDGRPYSQAVKIGDYIYISGQSPKETDGTGVFEQTASCFEGIESILESCGLSLKYILKTTLFLTDLDDLDEVDKVYREKLSEPYPVRSVVSVSKLPNHAKVTIEAFAMDTRALEVLCAKDTADGCSGKECSIQQ